MAKVTVSIVGRFASCAFLVLIGLVVTTHTALARADEDRAPLVAESAPELGNAERSHHRRGLELYDDGEFRLSLIEFERAYAAAANYKVLYNVGQVHFQLNEYAKARLALEQYLKDGGTLIAPKRREEVEKDLVTLSARTATLTVRVNVSHAEITINQTLAGNAPLESQLVDAGTLRVQVTCNGYIPRVREVTLGGGDQQVIAVELMESRPNVVVTQTSSGLRGAAVAGWVVTGLLVTGAVGTGIAAVGEKSAYDAKRSTPVSSSPSEARGELDRQRNVVGALAVTTDILAGAALVAGGLSLYLTLREPKKPDAPQVRVHASGALFTMRF